MPSTAASRADDPLEARRAGPSRGNGLFTRRRVEAGCALAADRPVCVTDADGHTARLPRLTDPDELMVEIVSNARWAHLVSGPWRMSHVPRHLNALSITPAELPEWARRRGLSAHAYALLGAQLQSNVARHSGALGSAEDDDVLYSMILLPRFHLVNHACEPNCELLWDPADEGAECANCAGACGDGRYVLRARRAIGAGEEVTFSYPGLGRISELARAERRAELDECWGFWCQCALCADESTSERCQRSAASAELDDRRANSPALGRGGRRADGGGQVGGGLRKRPRLRSDRAA